jgi:NAD(P)H-dependent FMN reductase
MDRVAQDGLQRVCTESNDRPPAALRLLSALRRADGLIIATPTYHGGVSGLLKNALDYLGREWAWKPIGFISYGNTSAGTRSVQHAKQVKPSGDHLYGRKVGGNFLRQQQHDPVSRC